MAPREYKQILRTKRSGKIQEKMEGPIVYSASEQGIHYINLVRKRKRRWRKRRRRRIGENWGCIDIQIFKLKLLS
jgi:hypothetical protein